MNIFIPDIYAKDSRLSWPQKIFLAEIVKLSKNGLEKVHILKKDFIVLGFTAWEIRTFLNRLKDLNIISTEREKDKRTNRDTGLILSLNNAKALQEERSEEASIVVEEKEVLEKKNTQEQEQAAIECVSPPPAEFVEAEPNKTIIEEILPNVPAPNEPPQKRSKKISGEDMSQLTFFQAVSLIENIMNDIVNNYISDRPELANLDIHSQAQAFVNHYSSTGWKAKGVTTLLKDIGLTARNWLYRTASYSNNFSNRRYQTKQRPLTEEEINKSLSLFDTTAYQKSVQQQQTCTFALNNNRY